MLLKQNGIVPATNDTEQYWQYCPWSAYNQNNVTEKPEPEETKMLSEC